MKVFAMIYPEGGIGRVSLCTSRQGRGGQYVLLKNPSADNQILPVIEQATASVKVRVIVNQLCRRR